ncbi:MAG: MaoC family dehydratase [Nevskiaceae bacterium]|nr:MAG: MaoC family dehydratase [Nevskiaceae bacterium]TBR73455.1 MAG: MaoC family dehydratase [Nevskiaceae bacterium]
MLETNPPIPLEDRCLEGYPVDTPLTFGPIAVSEAEIIEFARRYDPQTMHTDPAAAAAGPFKGLMASGWHTVGLLMRLFVENVLSPTAGLPSPGVKELKWTRPVRPGDRLWLRTTITEARPSRSNPDRGIVTTHLEGLNQNGEVVAEFTAANLVRRRGA